VPWREEGEKGKRSGRGGNVLEPAAFHSEGSRRFSHPGPRRDHQGREEGERREKEGKGEGSFPSGLTLLSTISAKKRITQPFTFRPPSKIDLRSCWRSAENGNGEGKRGKKGGKKGGGEGIETGGTHFGL